MAASRAVIYFAYGNLGALTPDTTQRYLPQIETLKNSWSSFFSLTGPLYTAFLYGMNRLFNDVVVPTALIQHLLGIATAFLVFRLLKKINIDLAFITVILVFCSPRSSIFEHLIIRDGPMMFLLACYLSALDPIVPSRIADMKEFKSAFLFFVSGFIGTLCFLLRIEYLPVILLTPLLIFTLRRHSGVHKSIAIYYLPIVITFAVMLLTKDRFPPSQYGGCKFCVAYTSVQKDVFNYPLESSEHPSLLLSYQQIMASCENVYGDCSTRIAESTDRYVRQDPQQKNSSAAGLLDKMYLEMIRRNTLVYLRSYGINFFRHLQGNQELPPSRKPQLWKDLLRVLFPQIIINNIMAVAFLCFLPLLFANSAFKREPTSPVIPFIVLAQLSVSAFVSNPIARFRYPLDPYIYFLALRVIYKVGQHVGPLMTLPRNAHQSN